MKERRNFVITIAILLIVGVFMTACGSGSGIDRESKDIEEDVEKDFGTFVVLSQKDIDDSDITQYIMYDPESMIMWTFMDGYKCGGPAILYNADGSMRIYEP